MINNDKELENISKLGILGLTVNVNTKSNENFIG